jgi:phosphatidylglycerophosphate synthase
MTRFGAFFDHLFDFIPTLLLLVLVAATPEHLPTTTF